MGAWIAANWASILVLLLLCGIVGLAIRSLVRGKKAGNSSCGCSCGSCPMCGSCHEKKE